MKSIKFLTGLAFIIGSLFFLQFYSCTHDDIEEADINPINYEYGDDVVNMTDWTFDQNHSSIRWETLYLGASALLTGRFNDFAIELAFDEDNPENISIMGRVTLSTVNTGEPGRDGGCLQSTFEVETRDEATFTSTHVELDGTGGYTVMGNLDFLGVVDEVIMKLNYTGSTFFDVDSGLNGAPFTVAGFTGEFEMLAISVFGIESHNIADRVVVKVNAQFKKPG